MGWSCTLRVCFPICWLTSTAGQTCYHVEECVGRCRDGPDLWYSFAIPHPRPMQQLWLQDLAGPIANASYLSRGYVTIPTREPLGTNDSTPVMVRISSSGVSINVSASEPKTGVGLSRHLDHWMRSMFLSNMLALCVKLEALQIACLFLVHQSFRDVRTHSMRHPCRLRRRVGTSRPR